jgi:hypothetical protein
VAVKQVVWRIGDKKLTNFFACSLALLPDSQSHGYQTGCRTRLSDLLTTGSSLSLSALANLSTAGAGRKEKLEVRQTYQNLLKFVFYQHWCVLSRITLAFVKRFYLKRATLLIVGEVGDITVVLCIL